MCTGSNKGSFPQPLEMIESESKDDVVQFRINLPYVTHIWKEVQVRKFTYKDVHDWKVVDNSGKVIPYHTKDKQGKKVVVKSFDGFRAANAVARKLGGYARRA